MCIRDRANADADKKERERVDKMNQADSMIFQTENQLKELDVYKRQHLSRQARGAYI